MASSPARLTITSSSSSGISRSPKCTERRAVRTALGHENRHAALRFLLELPDLAAADRLLRGQVDRLDPRHYELLNLAAERLADRYPLAATLLWRRKVEDVLERASSNQYSYAVRDLRAAAAVRPTEMVWRMSPSLPATTSPAKPEQVHEALSGSRDFGRLHSAAFIEV